MTCECHETLLLKGEEAHSYLKRGYLKEVGRAQGGWKYLLKCEICGSYWEMTWEGGGGFDYGIMVLRRLSSEELREEWFDLDA